MSIALWSSSAVQVSPLERVGVLAGDLPSGAQRRVREIVRTYLEIGPHTLLHSFGVSGAEVPGRQPILWRGRLDHFALNAASEETFREIRRRIISEGRTRPRAGSSPTWARC